ncbi:hypothetical protein QF038_000861 [Pseudarthrobacter sp. W1I19]|nr:hypothetical protein [Pseudarthrobacter sp. W1I19]
MTLRPIREPLGSLLLEVVPNLVLIPLLVLLLLLASIKVGNHN